MTEVAVCVYCGKQWRLDDGMCHACQNGVKSSDNPRGFWCCNDSSCEHCEGTGIPLTRPQTPANVSDA